MLDFVGSLPPWAFYTLIVLAGLAVVGVCGFFFSRMFRKLENHLPKD